MLLITTYSRRVKGLFLANCDCGHHPHAQLQGVVSTRLLQIVAELSSFSRKAKSLGFYVKSLNFKNSMGQIKPYL